MSFIETVGRAGDLLRERGRITLRGLKREFDLDDDALEELVDELVDAQRVATVEGKVLVWLGAADSAEGSQPTASQVVPPPSEADAERRHLTVMFCDLVGSTELGGQLDPEEFREVIGAYQALCAREVGRYDGTLGKYLGDGVLAYFGYPRAHEDDPVRAVHAALGILSELHALNATVRERVGSMRERTVEVRIGVHSGLAVIGEMGDGAKGEIQALGDTLNQAARLQGVAKPDTVVIGEATRRLSSGVFVLEDLGPTSLKGIAQPVPAYRVLRPSGVQSRLDIAAGRLTPFVGREQELGLLVDRWEQVLEGHGQTVLISGDAGIGKSRLALRLREHLRDEPHSWLEVRASPHGRASPLQPTIELVRQALLFSEGDDEEAKLDKIVRATDRTGLGEHAVALLADLLSVPLGDAYPPLRMSSELQREKTFELLVAWILSLGDLQPLLLLSEDLHWADPSSLELLGRIMDQAPTARVMLLLTARPEFEAPWSHPKNWTPITLGHLRRRQATAIIEALGDGSIPAEAAEQILERSDGVPLYVEELTRNLVEAGEGVAAPVPESLQASLTARLDRLSSAREVAQIASLLGREFPYRLLAAVAPMEEAALRDGLRRLVEADLMFRRGSPPDATFTFKHALIQDTAYESLLKSRRRELHGGIARVLEGQFPGEASQRPEEVARHFAAGELPEEAIAHYQRAGERAAERSANEEAIGHLTRAIELLGTMPETRARNQLELELQMALGVSLGFVRGYGESEYERAYERAHALASEIGEGPELAQVLEGLASSYYVRGDLTTSSELAKEALEAAERAGSAFDLLAAHNVMGSPLYWQGKFSRSLHHFEQGIGLYELAERAPLGRAQGLDRGVICHSYSAWCQFPLGYPDRALATSQQAVALARRLEHPGDLSFSLGFAAIIHMFRREPDCSVELADEAISVAGEFGYPLFLGIARAVRGWARAESPESGEALAEIQQALAELAQTETGIGAPGLLWMLAEASWRVAGHDVALGVLGMAVARAEEQGEHYYDSELHRLRAEILLDKDGDALEEAQTLLRRALEIARGQEAKSLELRAATSLARLLRDQGQRDQARELLAPLYEWFTEGFDTQDLKNAKALLEEPA